ncbi:hypothetical protein [Delftia acidovorans]|uniref:hypothetical protein n=1 Tax=Delftia acidovorans TaxID=80866 RepID=UPI0012D2E02F|nr:hypothetical protein [Delftia acidovorans]QQB53324.1 hypothetical protein I6H54_14190 [Delftia acidovorans]
MQKKACIVYTSDFEEDLPKIVEHLSENGFEVCVSIADQDAAEAAQAGNLSKVNTEIKECIENAEVCIFLIPKKSPESLTSAAKHAGALGTKIIAVVESTNSLPQIFDEISTAVVGVGSPQLPRALNCEEVWESPKDSTSGRKIPRIKCQ